MHNTKKLAVILVPRPFLLFNIPEQFTVKAQCPPSIIWRGGGRGEGGAKKVRNTFIPVYIDIHIQNPKTKL